MRSWVKVVSVEGWNLAGLVRGWIRIVPIMVWFGGCCGGSDVDYDYECDCDCDCDCV